MGDLPLGHSQTILNEVLSLAHIWSLVGGACQSVRKDVEPEGFTLQGNCGDR